MHNTNNEWQYKDTIVIDIDNTICYNKLNHESYADVKPIEHIVNTLNDCYSDNNYIILFTARGMRTYDGDIELINKHVRPELEKWLEKHGVKYDELIMGKPWGQNVIYVDDKAMTPEDFARRY